jgi:hypothetical protein
MKILDLLFLDLIAYFLDPLHEAEILDTKYHSFDFKINFDF